jgi:hypothetical protein
MLAFSQSNVWLEKASAVKKFAVSLHLFVPSSHVSVKMVGQLSRRPCLLGTVGVRIIIVNRGDPVSIQMT